jgi:hypothetical protein
MKLADILKLIQQKTTEMEMHSVFKEVAFDPFAAAAAAAAAKGAAAAAAGGSSRGSSGSSGAAS